MQFDRFTIALLTLRPDARQLSEAEAAALQDAHLAYLAGLHEVGHLAAAGPLLGGDRFRGLNIFTVEPDTARSLAEQDPAVRAGRFSVTVLPWMVPAGAVRFAPARFPHSIAEAESD